MDRLGTAKCGWLKWHSSNDSSSAFTAPAATTTKPSTNIIDRGLTVCENLIQVMPFGTGADNTTFDMRIIGWNAVSNGTLWVPTLLAGFSCTLSAAVGVAGSDVIATERFADTITAASYNPTSGAEAISPTGDVAGHVVVDVKGADVVQVVYDMTGATNANCLVKWL